MVVDASALVEFLLDGDKAESVAKRLESESKYLAAPHLLDIEVVHAVRSITLRGTISAERGAKAIQHLARMHIRRWDHAPLRARIWELRHNLSAYDAAYVALAEGIHAPLLTCDRSLAEAPGITCAVEFIG